MGRRFIAIFAIFVFFTSLAMAAGVQPAHARTGYEDRRVVAGVDVFQCVRGGIVFGNECGGEAAAVLAVAAGVVVHAAYQFGERFGGTGERFEAGLIGGHKHGRGHALAGYVGDGYQISAAGRV